MSEMCSWKVHRPNYINRGYLFKNYYWIFPLFLHKSHTREIMQCIIKHVPLISQQRITQELIARTHFTVKWYLSEWTALFVQHCNHFTYTTSSIAIAFLQVLVSTSLPVVSTNVRSDSSVILIIIWLQKLTKTRWLSLWP